MTDQSTNTTTQSSIGEPMSFGGFTYSNMGEDLLT